MPAVSEEDETTTGAGASSRPPLGATSIEPGARFGDLELDRKLGQGAQGVVYLGRQVSVNRQVAVKILPKDIAFTQEQIDRFLREGRTRRSIRMVMRYLRSLTRSASPWARATACDAW